MANKKLTDLDINSLHQLNMPAKLLLAALAALAILVFSYFLLFRSQLEMLNNAETKETELKATYEQKSLQAASLDNLKAELAAIHSSFDVLLKQLPTDA